MVDIPDKLSIPKEFCGKVEPGLTHIGYSWWLWFITHVYSCNLSPLPVTWLSLYM